MPPLPHTLIHRPAQATRHVLVLAGLCVALSSVFAEDSPAADASAPNPQTAVSAAQSPATAATPVPATSASEPGNVTMAPASAPVVAPAPAPVLAASKPATSSPARPVVPAVAAPVRPTWAELTKAQQQALQPLNDRWSEISEPQRRKWIALSQNFDRLSPDEREKLHSRMTDWASLSVQQRNQARLNFAATNKLAPDDKKAQWEAYQALSPEEREKLATGARKPPPGAALAIKPVPPEKMVVVPRSIARKDGATQPISNPTLLPRPAGSSPARAN